MKKKTHIFIRSILSICIIAALAFSIPYVGAGYVSAEEEAGSAIPEGYTPIYTVDDLYAINDNLAGNYILMNDIDMTETLVANEGLYDFQGNGWMPIGGGNTYAGGEFTGVFDGNNHSIKGMRIEVRDLSAGYSSQGFYIGLFAVNSGEIKNLTLVGGNIESAYNISAAVYAGGICGNNKGTIINCRNENRLYITASYYYSSDSKGYVLKIYAGGIAGVCTRDGDEEIKIDRCSNSGDIILVRGRTGYVIERALLMVGGIIGYGGECQNLVITESYNTGTIKYNSDDFAGYACGIGYGQKVSNCYNAGNIIITDKGKTYGIGDASTNCYTLASDSQYTYVIGNVVSNCYFERVHDTAQTGAVGLSSTQLKSKIRVTGFDYDNVWYFDTNSHYQYPQLRNNPHKTKTIEHAYDDGEVITPANCTNTGTIKYTCTVCGATKNDTLPIDEDVHGAERKDAQSGDIYCSLCNKLLRKSSNETEISPVNVVIYGVSVTLNEAIGMNFYIGIPEIEDTYTATLTQRNDSYNVELTSDMVTEISGKKMYKVTSSLNAKEVNDDIKIVIKNSNGYEYSFISGTGEEYGNSYSLSVSKYLKSLTNKDAKTTALVNALLDYGNSAQLYFDYFSDSAEAISEKVDAVTVSQIDNSGFSMTGKIDDFNYAGSSLVLESKVTIRHYFNVAESEKLAGYTFKVNGETTSVKYTGNYCYVEINNIMPTQLDDTYTLEVYKDGAVVYTLVYGTEKYVYDTLSRSHNEELVRLVKALHLYNVAANNYAA